MRHLHTLKYRHILISCYGPQCWLGCCTQHKLCECLLFPISMKAVCIPQKEFYRMVYDMWWLPCWISTILILMIGLCRGFAWLTLYNIDGAHPIWHAKSMHYPTEPNENILVDFCVGFAWLILCSFDSHHPLASLHCTCFHFLSCPFISCHAILILIHALPLQLLASHPFVLNLHECMKKAQE